MATIDPTPEYVKQLLSMVHSKTRLKGKGFDLQRLNQTELLKKLRCVRCNKRSPKIWQPDPKKKSKHDGKKGKSDVANAGSSSSAQNQTKPTASHSDGKKDAQHAEKKPRKPTCQWHTGKVQGNHWTCCRGYIYSAGCHSADTHDVPTAITPATVARYQVHVTPQNQPNDPNPKAIAVAIDCEMGLSSDGNSELIRLTVIEYFSATILLDTLVYPEVPMAHYNTRYSGVSAAAMDNALRAGTCLVGGPAAARAAVWRWVNADTVVVGHDVRNDLAAMRWAHEVVLDSMIVEEDVQAFEREVAEKEKAEKETAEQEKMGEEEKGGGDGDGDDEGEKKKAEKPKGPGLSLKAVSKVRLGRDIQKGAHDSLEDALASRDVVHYHVIASMAACT